MRDNNPEASLEHLYDPERFRTQGHALIDILADQLSASLQGIPDKVIPKESPEEVFQFWENDAENSPNDNLFDYFQAIIGQSTLLHHNRYIGHQVAVPAPDSMLAELLGAYLNNGMAVYEMGAAGTAIEQLVVRHLGKQLGWDDQAGGVLTSGGSLANLTALLAIRQIQGKVDVWKKGTDRQFAIMVSEQAHYCVDRAARIMGWGEKGVIKIPVNSHFQMRTELLEAYLNEAKQQDITVLGVVGSACTTSTGTYDPLLAISKFCQKYNLWFHVDGAHGAAVMYTDTYKSLISGIEHADSVVIDLHKMLMTPALTTALVFKNGLHSFQTFSQKADYLLEEEVEEEWHNIARRTVECTKFIMGVKFYTLLRTHGTSIFDQYVNTCYDLARSFADLIQQTDNWELATRPQSNIVCFRWMKSSIESSYINTLTRKVRQISREEGYFYLVQTVLHGNVYLRTTIMNPFTTIEDLKSLLNYLEGIYSRLAQIPEF